MKQKHEAIHHNMSNTLVITCHIKKTLCLTSNILSSSLTSAPLVILLDLNI